MGDVQFTWHLHKGAGTLGTEGRRALSLLCISMQFCAPFALLSLIMMPIITGLMMSV